MEKRDIRIRPARREDAAETARLWMQSAKEHAAYDEVYVTAPDAERMMRRFLSDLASGPQTFLFVATSEGQTVGFISGELREGSPTFRPKTWSSIEDVFVLPEYRSLGLGHALVDHVSSWAKRKGANGVSLQVAAANERAREFYTELGFREVSVYEVLEF